MSCARPFLRKTDRPYFVRYNGAIVPRFSSWCPCGMCLNCRVDRRNQWSDRAKYEYSKRLTGTFVTLTYDDPHMLDRVFTSPTSNELVCSLDYEDIKRFFMRLRKFIKRHEELHGVLCQPDFSYIYVGEYGENGSAFDRPHFHCLIFGLDFAFIEKYIRDEWKNGFVDCLPILDGGINYVLKYMDKQLFGTLAEERYDNQLLERPKMSSSRSFGANLFTDYADYAKEHDFTYPCGHGLSRPMTSYWKSKITGKSWRIDNVDYALREQKFHNRMYRQYNLTDFSTKAVDAFKLRLARIKERKLRQQILNDGVGVLDFVSDDATKYYRPMRERIRRLDDEIKHYLADEYRATLPYADATYA